MSNTETELKLRLANPAARDHLLSLPLLGELSAQPPVTQTLETTYYDTADYQLLRAGLSYRLRLADGLWTATVKADGSSDGGLHHRSEFNIPVDGPDPSIAPFLATKIGGRLAEAVGAAPLEPLFCTRFRRHSLDIVTADGSSIELALDDGAIVAGDKQQPILELELELKSGRPQSLLWLGASLAAEAPLLPEQDSKLYRAAQLAGLTTDFGQDVPQPFPLKKSKASQPAGQVLSQIIIYHIYEVIRAQQTYLSSQDNPQPLHSFRTSLRKLRALLNFAKPLLPETEYADWQGRLTDWGRRLGSARDLDVFAAAWHELNGYMSGLFPKTTTKPVLATLIADRRQQIRDSVYTDVAAGQVTPVLLGLWSFIECWQSKESDILRPTFKAFARERLAGKVKQFLKAGRALTITDREPAHELRVAGRRLRYTLDALAPVLPDKTRSLSKRLEELQDLLGSIQDVTFTLPLLKELVKASASRLTHRDTGLIIGWQSAKSATAAQKWDKVWTKVEKSATKTLKSEKLPAADLINKRNPEI